VDALAAAGGGAVAMEDYCHAVEHSIEFQVVFLQHLYGPGVRIAPVLCGSFGRSTFEGGLPEDDERVARFLDALAGLHSREGGRLFYVLGVDMAHVGRRYGDAFTAQAGQGPLDEVERRDRLRIASLSEGDAAGFWKDVQADGDALRWCGSSPLYTFLRAVPARAELLRYEQWNIDEGSVVSFAGLAFRNARGDLGRS
jgi:AmmeMemoRadiSam system protein B